MSAATVEQYPDRETWLSARRRGIGGSDVPAILGLSSYATPLSVWASKTGNEAPRDSTYSMRRGHHMERFIAEELAECVSGLRVERLAGDTDIARSTFDERLAYSPDAYLLDDDPCDPHALGEWKSQLRAEKNWRESVPLDVQAQVQHGMFVLGLPRCYVAVDLGTEMRWDCVQRDPTYGETVVPALLRWWDRYVETLLPPPVTGADADSAVLRSLFPEDSGGSVRLGSDFERVAEKLDAKKALISATQKEVQALENEIKAAMGDQSRGELRDGSGWSWKTQQRAGYTVEPGAFRVLRRFGKGK